ncbi:hypothetical protein WN51_03362 [Melipona quadrifasciata]|uniref:Uncharacterized protein n=1 Tax=Melipona quadrifasciata TaxID=166423 RepID=A0A0M8ZWB5_9HYME|nr:hypothetical protein WN51_03362 [Melipona quadrifasciata]
MQAISFANIYFSLVDGLISGLENCLSENVVLDWFGNVIEGRKNVSAFIKNHKTISKHIFLDITPITGVSFEEKHSNWAKFCLHHNPPHQECQKEDNNFVSDDGIREEMEKLSMSDAEAGNSQNKIHASKVSCDLSEGDISNTSKLEISLTNIEKIKHSLKKLNLQEETSTIERERDQKDEHIKYVEANGEIKFWKSERFNWSFTPNNRVWRRLCKLQIAYTILPDKLILESLCKIKEENTTVHLEQTKAKLPSLDEIIEIANKVVPNTNDFDGFLKDINFFDDFNDFVKHLETETAIKNSSTSLNLHYVEDKLVFNRPSLNVDDGNDKDTKKSVHSYQIHLIIYQNRLKSLKE